MIKPIVSTIVVGAIQTNCYVVKCPETGAVLVIDPGGDHALIENEIVRLDTIIYTHGHFDHVGGSAMLVKRFAPETMIHRSDADLMASAASHGAEWGFRIQQPPPADRFLEEGDSVRVGRMTFLIRHTPGHSKGSICVEGHGLLFSGDTLFAGSVGRTDLPGSSLEEMRSTLKRIVMQFDHRLVVYPGHGPATTMGDEKRNNPYLKSP